MGTLKSVWWENFDDDYFEREADAYAKRQKDFDKWKSKQPEYIACEMANSEIVKLIFDEWERLKHVIQFVVDGTSSYTPCGYKFIKGKLYKKIKNPKEWGKEIIPWE